MLNRNDDEQTIVALLCMARHDFPSLAKHLLIHLRISHKRIARFCSNIINLTNHYYLFVIQLEDYLSSFLTKPDLLMSTEYMNRLGQTYHKSGTLVCSIYHKKLDFQSFLYWLLLFFKCQKLLTIKLSKVNI